MRVDCEHGQTYEFNPRTIALLCVDYQMDFLDTAGFCAARGTPVRVLRRVLEPAQRVLSAARHAGVRIIHTRECYSSDLSNLNAFRKARDPVVGQRGPLGRFLVRGESGTAIVPELSPRAGEVVIDKPGFNAFHATDLNRVLTRAGISHLVIMGVTTQVCVASTLRGAVDQGYFPLLLSDCCAAYEELDHAATLRVIYSENHQFGWVSDSTRLLASLDVVGDAS